MLYVFKCASCKSLHYFIFFLLAVIQDTFYLNSSLFSLHFPEVSDHFSQSQPPITGTVTAPGASTTLPDSTAAAAAEDHSNSNRCSLIFVAARLSDGKCFVCFFSHFCALLFFRVSWSFGLPLVAIVSITVMMLIVSVTGVVCCRVRAKYKQSGKQFPENGCHKDQNVCQSLLSKYTVPFFFFQRK